MGFLENWVSWLLKPFFDEEEDKKIEEIKKTIGLKEYTLPNIGKKVIFKPQNFNEYIGQYRTKEILTNYIKGIKNRKRVFPHTLISGSPGMGKTTLTEIIAIYLGVPYHNCVAGEITNHTEILKKILLVDSGILFIDEIHSLKREFCESLYPLMEEFKGISPFTLIGATTEVGEIIKDRKPFYDRFKIILELEDYTFMDLVKIACQYKNELFEEDIISKKTYEILANNSRGCPRSLLRLLEATIYFDSNIYKVLNAFGILKNGYTIKDLKLLEYIKNNRNGVGLNNIANYLGTSQENYLYEIEPFLLKSGLILRTGKGRILTDLGLITIKELGGKI